MDLTAYPTEMLLQELNSRGTHGVVSLTSKATGRLEVWWGDRVKCLGLACRLTTSINAEMDTHEDAQETDDAEAEGEEGQEEAHEASVLDYPTLGQYL